MSRIGYAPGAFDLFHIGHLNLLREARSRCDFLIAGVVTDDVLITHKGIRPVIPLSERLEIVRLAGFERREEPLDTFRGVGAVSQHLLQRFAFARAGACERLGGKLL